MIRHNELRLYKAKDKFSNEWVTGYLWRGVDSAFIHPHMLGYSFSVESTRNEQPERILSKNYVKSVNVQTISEQVGYIGNCSDSLYTNDLVQGVIYNNQEVTGVVDFDLGAYGIRWVYNEEVKFTPFISIPNIPIKKLGNIFDNPELVTSDVLALLYLRPGLQP